jgi:3-oxoacyl-[acyl-carrier protein] reductase
MSKAAVAMMAKLFAIRLAPNGITVYEVRPGLIYTPMTDVAQSRFDKLLEEGFTPINRWGTPEDVGRAVATMAAGELPFTTGAAIQVDGGMHIHQYCSRNPERGRTTERSTNLKKPVDGTAQSNFGGSRNGKRHI